MTTTVKNDMGLAALAVRWVIGWTYFSAFYRRVILADKLNPETAGYIGEKFNHFLPNALGIQPMIQYMVENPDVLWWTMVVFTIIEGIVGLFIILGLFTRLMSVGVFGLAMGILLGAGWIGTTCLDEWQIGVLGIATGFMLFLTGSDRYSVDNYLMKRKAGITQKKWFAWLGSGELPVHAKQYSRGVLLGSVVILGFTLYTNQVFHGGVWGTLHNKSVKPKLELTDAVIADKQLSFDLYRTEGVDVYGAWIIGISLTDRQGNNVTHFDQTQLSALLPEHIVNAYVAKVKPGAHSLIVPLGAKARMHLPLAGTDLPQGNYTLTVTDISGASWSLDIEHP